MNRLHRSTVFDILSLHYPEKMAQILGVHAVEEMPFYSELYNYTYNQGTCDHVDDMVTLVKKEDIKDSLEIMSGNAFESYILHKKTGLPVKAVDIDLSYFDKNPGVEYFQEDCTIETPSHRADLVFVGATNASLCCILDMVTLKKIFNYAYKACNKVFVASCFFPERREDEGITYEIEAVEMPIKYGSRYVGGVADWLQVCEADGMNSTHTYYDLAIIKHEGKIERVLYCGGYKVRGWRFTEIKYAAESAGFRECSCESGDSRFIICKK